MRLRDYTPCSHLHTHTVFAALRVDGLSATAVFDVPIDNPTFLAYVEQVLDLEPTGSTGADWTLGLCELTLVRNSGSRRFQRCDPPFRNDGRGTRS